jgi:hypothetical protein
MKMEDQVKNIQDPDKLNNLPEISIDSPANPDQKKGKGKKKNKKKAILSKKSVALGEFDARGVQTLFRTMSRNHYNLLRMVDAKASIVLTINSIIISLLMGVMYIAPDAQKEIMIIGFRILTISCMLSMIFATMSMLPHKYLGKKFNDSTYKGSLYAGNFTGTSHAEFKKEFERIIATGYSVYNEMIDDLYFLGTVIQKKQKMIIFSVFIFITGLIASIIFNISIGLKLFGS